MIKETFKMYEMENELKISDLKIIIRNLISFIVIEGKECVQESKKQEYVSGYIHLLVKIVNDMEEQDDYSIIKDIVDDITRYIK